MIVDETLAEFYRPTEINQNRTEIEWLHFSKNKLATSNSYLITLKPEFNRQIDQIAFKKLMEILNGTVESSYKFEYLNSGLFYTVYFDGDNLDSRNLSKIISIESIEPDFLI